ncbi:uncharacterized protein LOC101208775 isoform X1 [Cucumis sativus]|uniref:uncharacterized protein LOC101208775 isoform X1 n=1 Tax=Cucumis sativus TaxID=3659 RepID=UPI0012F51CDF|nr:uncharacterized protein LOC101208775 isoform X1 [Cucumis sativus]XP_031745029.1 uncharacterized protein LOC101208775 isoform X1 [Cucumis sativus]
MLKVNLKYSLGGCLGCYTKPKLKTHLNEPSKGQQIQCHGLRKPSLSEDFWTTSTFDVDNSAGQSQGSMSSLSTINHMHDPHGSSGNVPNPSEFLNHGLLLWNQTRQRWTGNKRSEKPQFQEPKLDWNVTYESLLGSNKPFRQPIPLGEMVDFLVDVWEQEGLYD